ncbi:unnamed protein product [Arabidopsis halleri]
MIINSAAKNLKIRVISRFTRPHLCRCPAQDSSVRPTIDQITRCIYCFSPEPLF